MKPSCAAVLFVAIGVASAQPPAPSDAGRSAVEARADVPANARGGVFEQAHRFGWGLAFVSERTGQPQLHRFDASGEGILTTPPGSHYLQAVAVKSGQAVVTRAVEQREQLVTVALADAGVRVLTPAVERAHAAKLSFDERHIVFEGSLTEASNVALLNIDGEELQFLPSPCLTGAFEPSFTRTNEVLLTNSCSGDPEIYRMNLDGGLPVRLTAFHKEDFGAVGNPRKNIFAFVSSREGAERVFVEGLDGKNLTRLMRGTRNPNEREQNPVWMPDGDSLLVTVTHPARLPHFQLISIQTRQVLWTAQGQMPQPTPDGRFIAFVCEHDGNPDVCIMTADGGTRQRLTNHPAAEYSPHWVQLPGRRNSP